MNYAERIQAMIHKLEVDEAGVRWMNYVALTVMVVALGVWYDTHCYRDFSSPEAMDAAQVARNVAEGNGFTTEFVRPFSIFLLQRHNHALAADQESGTNVADPAEVFGRHPDLANAPLYPLALAGLFKINQPDWKVDMRHPFWFSGGRFQRYKPEFVIAIFNQVLLLLAVLLTFLVAKMVLRAGAALLAAVLMLSSDTLWKFSVSGLPTLLLLVIFLGLTWSLVSFEALSREEKPKPVRQFLFAATAGLFLGLGMLTRYSFGWVIAPVVVFLILFGGRRRTVFAGTALFVFVGMVTPWILRNIAASGTPFGTAGYAVVENSEAFPGSLLMQSLNPEMFNAFWRIVHLVLVKLAVNLPALLRDDMTRLGDGWVGILFLAGLLLNLRNLAARRLRYFTMMCLGVLLVITALGRTPLSDLSPDMNAENLLVLLLPLAVIFGVAFFRAMLNQMEIRFAPMRYVVIIVAVILLRLPLTLTLLPPRTSPVAYPPYYPPDIQKFSAWMQPNELIMSDIPWAVAWYGDRQCTWTTINCRYEFNLLNDFIKPVNALYLTLNTLDGKFLTDCVKGGDNWGNFAYKSEVYNKAPKNFPLGQSPFDTIASGLFLADRQRW